MKYDCKKQGWEEGGEEGGGVLKLKHAGGVFYIFFIVDNKTFLLSMRLRDRYNSSWFPR